MAKQTSGTDRVSVFIPRGDLKGDPNLYVSVNEWSGLLPRGKTSEVPRYVAEEIARSEAELDALCAEMDRRSIRQA